MGSEADASWREQRLRAVESHARAQREAAAARSDQARRLIAGFVRTATASGPAPVRLTAPAYRGRTRYRTKLSGWYLDVHRSLAVGTDGEFYVLGVPNSLRARLFGADVRPTAPPLVVGEGGKDGEAIALAELLERRLRG